MNRGIPCVLDGRLPKQCVARPVACLTVLEYQCRWISAESASGLRVDTDKCRDCDRHGYGCRSDFQVQERLGTPALRCTEERKKIHPNLKKRRRVAAQVRKCASRKRILQRRSNSRVRLTLSYYSGNEMIREFLAARQSCLPPRARD